MQHLIHAKQHLLHFLSGYSLRSILIATCVFFLILVMGIQTIFSISIFQKNEKNTKILEKQTAHILSKELDDLETANEHFQILKESDWLPNGYGIAIKNMENETLYSDGAFPEGLTLPSPARSYSEISLKGGTLYFEKNDTIKKYVYLPSQSDIDKKECLYCIFTNFLLVLLIFFLLYRCLIFPLISIDKILQNAIEGDFDYNYKNLRHSVLMQNTFSNLEMLLTDIKQLTTKEANAQLMMKQAEINALQSQINPHFLYNTLDSIRGQAFQYGAKDIQVMTLALSKLFRYSISNQKSHVTLEEELNNINNYLMIQQIRFCNKFIIKKQIERDTLQCKIPKLIVQPIVENAVHHGLEPKMGSGTLTLRAYRTQSRLIIEVKDDGVGIPADKIEKLNHALAYNTTYNTKTSNHTSVGLINTNSRIKLCFGPEYGLSIYSTPSIGSNVIFSLPIQEDSYTS